MDWYGTDLKNRGILYSQLVGYKMAGGDNDLNTDLLLTLQAMIAVGYDAEKIRIAEDFGVTIQLIENQYEDEYDPSPKIVYWGAEDDYDGFPAMAWLAHEIEHGWQYATDHYWHEDYPGHKVYYDYGNITCAKMEEGAMIAANDMGLACYKKVPAYGKGGSHETKGPYTAYWYYEDPRLTTGEVAPAPPNMTWDEYEKMRWYIASYEPRVPVP